MAQGSTTGLRHIPKQVRGRRTVEHILHSAEALFAEVGFENTTTNAISSRAGISIGSLYQFFSSKEAILSAIAGMYLDKTRVALSETLGAGSGRRLGDLLTELIETLLKLQEQRPFFLQCLGQSRPSPVLADAVNELNAGVIDHVTKLLDQGSGTHDMKLLRIRARICVETMSALLPIALYARGRDRDVATAEIKSVLSRYIEPMLKVKGIV
jgi:AcrR family transcriptional regulator